jgi:aconitate hydratase
LTDTLINSGEEVMLGPTTSCRKNGFDAEEKVFKSQLLMVQMLKTVSETSERLQLLAPLLLGMEKHCGAKLLIKAFGKCTTDHIYWTMVAFPWTFR